MLSKSHEYQHLNSNGVFLCSRFSYPPNSLSLCGPDKKKDLHWYSSSGQTDHGTVEILMQFSTLFPYLSLIAYDNNIRDPFSPDVVEAYWLGNRLLHTIQPYHYARHLIETLKVKKRMRLKDLHSLLDKLSGNALPHHAFHVLNVYKRTGHIDIPHTIETMDACLINWGHVVQINRHSILVKTKPLRLSNSKLAFGNPIIRSIIPQGEKDVLFAKLRIGDVITYHWGYFCQKLMKRQLRNLIYYTKLALQSANSSDLIS